MIWITADPHLGHANIIDYCNRPFFLDEIRSAKAKVEELKETAVLKVQPYQAILESFKRQGVEQMDNKIIGNYNRFVKPEDTLKIVGDFSMSRNFGKIMEYRNRIQCENVELILGNHDALSIEEYQQIFQKVSHYEEFDYNGNKVVLSHYAMRVWNKAHKGAWHLYGHSHGSLLDLGNRSFDVGVDCWNFKPLSMKQIQTEMSKRVFKPVDGHKERY